MRNYMPTAERIEQIKPMLKPTGTTRKAIAEAISIKTKSAMNRIMGLAVASGAAFQVFARVSTTMLTPEMVYFPTAADRDAFVERYTLQKAEREKARQAKRSRASYERHRGTIAAKRSAERKAAREQRDRELAEAKALRAAEREITRQRERLEREAKVAEKAREMVEAKKQKARLRVLTKAAGRMSKIKGTATPPAPPKPKGPAHIVGELDLSRAKVTVAPPPRDRWAVGSVSSVVDSRECRPWAEKVAA